MTSPTNLLSQEIVVSGFSGQVVTVTLETGTFTGVRDSTGTARVTVPLNPNTTHHLTVTFYYPKQPGGCNYGGYFRSTTVDINGQPLTIVQQSSVSCQVAYTFLSRWSTGFTAEVRIKNTGTTTINGWTLTWTFTGDEQIIGNPNIIQVGKNVTARDAGWNRTIAPGGTVSLGFQARSSNPKTPINFKLNGVPCGPLI